MRAHSRPTVDDVASFYDAAAPDFPRWSSGRNIHFGYWRRGIDPRDLEAMLEQMNTEVAQRLALPAGPSQVLDLGCGLGATARAIATCYGDTRVLGLTVAASQVADAAALNRAASLESRIEVRVADFHDLEAALASNGHEPGRYDGAYAVESFCYAHEPDRVVRGLAELLRPGARFVVADAFVPHERMLAPLSRRLHGAAARRWRLPEFPRLPAFERALRRAGFRVASVEDISWRVAPSVMHVPGKVARMTWTSCLAGIRGRPNKLSDARRDNAVAPLFGALVGLQHRDLRYQIVVAER